MSKLDEVDNTTKNIVKEIMRELTNKGIVIADTFVAYYAKLLILDPSWGIVPDALADRNDVQNFVKHCMQILAHQERPFLITLKIQLYFMANFDSIENMIVRNRTDLKARLEPLEREVLSAQTDVKEEMDRVYKKIIYLITLYAGLGNPTIKTVFNEADAALRSIFLDTDLLEFMDLPLPNKELQIVELTELVTGIRLFNRDNQKGGAGIEDLPKLLSQAIEVTHSDIQKLLVTIMDNVYLFTTAIDNCYKLKENERNVEVLVQDLPEGVTDEDVEHAKDLLIAYRQYELFVRKFLVELGRIEKMAGDKFRHLLEALARVNETVRFRIAIPTIQVFPLFYDVAHLWCELQDQTISLSQLNQMLLNLQTYMKELSMNEPILKLMVGPDGPITDGERLERTAGLKIEAIEGGATVIDFISMEDFDSWQYLGFCAWKFVETEGALIPGDPTMGVVEIQNKYFVFSSPEAASAFGADPTRYILRALDLARRKPQLINLLELQEQLVAVREIQQLVVEIPEVLITYDTDVQTDVHPISTKIDPNYMWNIWDWKRQAIMLANISRCQTHSTQTIKSQAWNAVRTQTQFTKNFTYQTKKDNYSNVPTVSNYIYGLRGRKDNVQHIITLTRPVEEQCRYMSS